MRLLGLAGYYEIFVGYLKREHTFSYFYIYIQISPPNLEISEFNNGIQLTITLVTLL